jgi:excinuclease ABC subunit C
MNINQNLKKIYNALPNLPGVYIFLNTNNKAIYIGKAKALKKRVSYYVTDSSNAKLPKRLSRMVSQAINLQYHITQTEQDALLLEAQLIKEKQPIYNILYRHGRSLYYLALSDNHDFPRVEIINEWKKGAIGPFLSADYVYSLLTHVLKIFKLRTCSDYVFAHRKRPCLEYYTNRCSGPCLKLIEKYEYEKSKDAFLSFFNGKIETIQKAWKTELKEASKKEDFEKAAIIRNKLIAIEKLNWKQNIHFENIKKLDVIACFKNHFYIEQIRLGAVINIEYRKYEKQISLQEFLLNFYIEEPEYRVIGPEIESDQSPFFKKYSSKLTQLEKKIFQQSETRMYSLINQNNIEQDLAKLFQVDYIEGIEIYDSSHYAGKHALSGMVFYDGQRFVKNKYRYWKLQQETKDDLKILEYSLTRRCETSPLPKIILLDGGVTQLKVARSVVLKKDPECKIFAFAKGENRKGGTLYFHNQKEEKNEKVEMSEDIKLILEKLRDEAHRWAKKNAERAFSKAMIKDEALQYNSIEW